MSTHDRPFDRFKKKGGLSDEPSEHAAMLAAAIEWETVFSKVDGLELLSSIAAPSLVHVDRSIDASKFGGRSDAKLDAERRARELLSFTFPRVAEILIRIIVRGDSTAEIALDRYGKVDQTTKARIVEKLKEGLGQVAIGRRLYTRQPK